MFASSLLALALLLVWFLFSWLLWYTRRQFDIFLLFSLAWGGTLAAFALTVVNRSPGMFSWLPFPFLAGLTLAGLTTMFSVFILCTGRYLFRRKHTLKGLGLATLVILAGPMVTLREEPVTVFSFWMQAALLIMCCLVILLAFSDIISALWQRWHSRGKTGDSEAQLLPANNAQQPGE